jgi:TRAP-type C4-dicarboxylate transport system permease small subunit
MSEQLTNITLATDETGSRFDRLFRVLRWLTVAINLTGATIVVVTLSSMFLAIFINVVLRYAFGSGIAWAYEIHNILFPWLVAGGAVMAAANGRNIAVTAFVDILPRIGQRILAILIHAFVAVLSVGIIYYSMPIIRASQYSRLAETGIQQMYGYFSLVYAFGAIALISVFFLLRLLFGEETHAADPTSSNFS